MQPMHMNNDVEGWHNRINSKRQSQFSLNMYLLITHLEQEAKLVHLSMQFISRGEVLRY